MTEIYPDSTSAFISNIGPGLLIAADSTSAAMRAARLQQNAASQNADTQEQELQETVQSLLEDVRGLQQRFAANGMLTAAAQAAFEALVDISVLRAPGDSDSLSATGGGAPDGGAEDGHAVAGLVTHGTNEVTQVWFTGFLHSLISSVAHKCWHLFTPVIVLIRPQFGNPFSSGLFSSCRNCLWCSCFWKACTLLL